MWKNLKGIDLWVTRVSSIGAAQSRYLWLLLLFGVFFLSLKPTEDSPSYKVPGVGFPIDVEVLEAAGPVVLSTLIILVHGTMRAHGGVLNALGFARDPNVPLTEDQQRLTEALDASPNPLDFAAYTWEKWEGFPHVLLLMNYPIYLGLFIAEALYLWCRLAFAPSRSPDVIVLLAIGGLAVFAATLQTIQLAWFRFQRIRAVLNRDS